MNTIQFLRTTTAGAAPPLLVSPGEPVAILDQLGRVDFYVGDSAGTPILINPAPTPVGGVEMDYTWSSDTTIGDPGAGKIKLNGDQDPAGASPGTTISVSHTTGGGNNFEQIWATVKPGDYIGMFERGGGGGAGGEIFYFLVTGTIPNTGWMRIDGSLQFYGGNDIDNNRPVAVFLVPDPTQSAGDLYSAPTASQNLVQPTADHPAMRFLRSTAGHVKSLIGFYDELSGYLSGIDANGNPENMTWDCGMFLSVSVTNAGLTCTATIADGIAPYDISWGDGNSDLGVPAGAHPHTYAAPGPQLVTVTDATGTTATATAEPV